MEPTENLNSGSTNDEKDSKNSPLKEKAPFTYTAEKIVGSGTFGVVYQAKCVETGETVAIKKVFQDKRYKNRELQIIKDLSHPNIVDEVYLNLVMEFVPDTLSRMVRTLTKQKKFLPDFHIKLYSYQMFRALNYLHAVGITHRDIKPQNMLINPETQILKLCDFGSAKKLVKGEPNISYICSRYYRAPELIFGATDYTADIDTWSVGCVMAEMFLGKPIFPGESAVDQLVEIIKVLGTPTFEQVKIMNPDYKDFKFPNIKPFQWNKLFKNHVDVVAIDLISKVLVYTPKERLSPVECLMHPYFNEVRNQKNFAGASGLEHLFSFSKEEKNAFGEKINLLVPLWYKEN